MTNVALGTFCVALLLFCVILLFFVQNHVMNLFMRHLFLFVLFVVGSCNSQTGSFQLNTESFNKKRLAEKNAILLDVRTPEEYARGFIHNALNIDYNNAQFENNINALDKEKTYLVYCLSGGRSGEAAKLMRAKGFKQVYELSGGILAWKKESLPLEIPKSGISAAETKIDRSIETFDSLLAAHPKLLIDFYAPWCGPCRKMAPMIEAMQKDYAGKVAIIKINVDDHEALANKLGISQIPLFHFYVNGKLIWKQEGTLERKELENVLNK